MLNSSNLSHVEGMENAQAEPVSVLDFRVYVTNEQKIKLRDWLNANGIRFCRVPKFGD